ncbi:MAG: S8 family serine peptidase [Candidatus Methanoperedens sp.]|nr:S8 family serine peptidase [Candidatus Methanoperedens sp.]
MNESGSIAKTHVLIVGLLIASAAAVFLFNAGASENASAAEEQQVTAVSNPKIHKELQTQIQKAPKERISILIQLEKEDDIDTLADFIKTKEGDVIGKFKIGKVIAVNISADKIEGIANHYAVKKIWKNRKYHALLDKSVPQINAPVMWNKGYNGSGIRIAILDTGINTTHPMLQGKVVLQKAFTGENHTSDVNGHGTHVAGISAGKKVSNQSYNGTAPGALLINAKVLDDSGTGDDISVIGGINWAVNPDGNSSTHDGADIISMSLGGPYSDLNSPILSAIKDAVNTGVVVVVASGNCGKGAPSISCNGYIGVETPGISPDAITVGAVDDYNNWAGFSSGGYVNGSVKPDVVAPGVYINSSIPGGYASLSGTSMAAPHVAGAVALLLQANRNLTSEQVKYILEYTSIHLGDPGKDIQYGSGLINASKFVPSNVDKLLKYRLTFPDAVYRGETFNITVNATSGNVTRINATIIDPNKNASQVNFTNITARIWNASFKNTSELGEYALDVLILDTKGNSTRFNEKFEVIGHSFPLTNGTINEIIIPERIPFNETLPVVVVFENTGGSPLDVLIEAQIIDGNNKLIGSEESNRTVVNPRSIKYFNLSWIANAPLGVKKLKAIASYEGEAYIKEKNFTIIDNSTPVISSVNYNSIFSRNNPVLIKTEVNDMSSLTGNITIKNPSGSSKIAPLKTLSTINYVHTLAGTYTDTNSTGKYTFNLTVCDSAGFCKQSNQYTFNITDCSNPQVLVVSEHNKSNPDRYVKALNNSYCVSIWNKPESDIPELSYLQRFGAVFWSTGNYWADNVDDNSSKLLVNYTLAGGKLVLEGPDIAFEHGYDELMRNVTHSEYEEDMFLLGNTSNVSIIVTRSNPIFKGMPGNISYNASLSPYPDSLVPTNDGVELARWSENGSAVVAFNAQNPGARTMLIPFMMDALGSFQNTFIKNIADWVTTSENNADLVVDRITYNYLIKGNNSINISIENRGSLSATNARVDIFLDNVSKKTLYATVPAGGKTNLTSTLAFDAGLHGLKVELNSNFNVTERNYLNNLRMENVSVATIEADLIPKSLSFDIRNTTVNISARVQNIGGSYAGNTIVEFWVDSNLTVTNISVGYNQTANASVNWSKRNGAFDVLVKVNPSRAILESNYSNNNISERLYVCNKSNVLIVDDNDASDYSTDYPGSADDFDDILKNNGYCTDIWSEAEKGIPSIGYLNSFDTIVWSAGDYWNTVINESDAALLQQYKGKIIFEGSDIGFDHTNDTFMQNYLHSQLERDLILSNQTGMVLKNHEIFKNISSISINSSLCPYPDSLMPTNGTSIANWSNANSSIIVYNDSVSRVVYYAFSIDGITDAQTKEILVLNSMEWVAGLNDIKPPASVTNLKNTTYTSTYINWTWTDPADPDLSYVKVYLDGIFKTNVTKGVKYYLASNLIQNTSHTIATRTVDTSGNMNSTWVNHTARTAVDVTPPASVTNLKNITYNANSINWTWNDPADSDLSGIRIYLNGVFKINVSKGVKYYLASNLNQNTTYTIATRTVDLSGNINSTWVNHTAKTAIDITPPASVTNLRNITYNANSINWTWNDPTNSDLSKVRVYVDGIFKSNVSKGVKYYLASGFGQNTTHTISTRTVDLSNNTNQSWINHTARTAVDVTPPASITNLKNITYNANSINWTWTDPANSDLSSVRVYLDGVFKTNVTKGTKYYLATGLGQNTTHTISTRTIDLSGNTNQSWINHTARTAVDVTPPASVTNLKNITYNANSINWTWTDPTDSDLSYVKVYIDGVFKTNVTKGIKYYLASGLAQNTTHTIATRTVDLSGNINSTWVNHTARTAVDITPPASVTNLRNITYIANSINWTWTDPIGSDLSSVRVYLDGVFKTNVTKGTKYYLATGLGQNTTHTISTRTVDLSDNTNQSWINHTARTAVDITPPASVNNLQNNSYASTYINWTWTDPADSDLSYVMIYFDGVFKTNVTKGMKYYLASNLTQNASHTIATRTADTSENMNSTWVNHTAMTAP